MTAADRPSPARRAAALGALGTAAAGLVVAVASLRGDVLRSAAVVVALLLAVAAAWTAATRTGALRWLATTVVAAAVLGALALVLTAEASGLGLVAGVALLAASVALCRRALAPLLAPPADDGTAAEEVPAAGHGVLIMNLRSGGGKAERFDLAGACRERGVEAVVLGPGDDLRTLAEQAVARGADVIGMAGGDGSQALVAAVAARAGIPLVCVPAGTRNHFALDLGLDREDVVGALDAFGPAREVRIDLGTVAGRVFVNNVSLGVYARLVQSHDYREAKARTTATLLPEMLAPGADRRELRYPGPDGAPSGGADVLQVSNNPYVLTSLTGFGTRPRLDTGHLGIATMRVERAAGLAALVAAGSAGRLDRCPGWAQWTTRSFRVDADGPIAAGVDGEALLLDPPLDLAVLPRALRVRLPRTARRPRPAAVGAPPWWSVLALVRVVRGQAPERDARSRGV